MTKGRTTVLVIAVAIVASVVTMAFAPGDLSGYGPEIVRGAATMALTKWEPGGGKVIEGKPQESGSERLGVSHDDSSFAAIWECTPGKFSWSYGTDETLYLLEGRITLWHDGQMQEAKAGDLVTFHAGSQVIWHVHERVRKVAFLHKPSIVGRVKKWLKQWV